MRLLLLLLVPLLWAETPKPGSALVADWNTCLDRIDSFEAVRRGRVPDRIWDVDPSLRGWRTAIPVQRTVFEWTTARLESGGAPERHLAENGVQGCERFRTAYETRGDAFFLVLAALSSLILLLTARVALAMVPATSPGASDVQDDSSDSPPRSSSGAS